MAIDNMDSIDQFDHATSPGWTPPPDDMDFEASDTRWFAGMAMQAIIERLGVPTSAPLREEIALWSFRMAEAMVKADEVLHGRNR